MRLIWNWRPVLKKAWSVRFLAFSILFSGVETALPYTHGILPIPNGVFAALSFAAVVAAGISRFVAQRGLIEP